MNKFFPVILAVVVLGIGYYLLFNQIGEVGKQIAKGNVYIYFVKSGETGMEFIPRQRDIEPNLAESDALLSTLQLLLAGPTEQEKASGLATVISPQAEVQSVKVKDGLVTVSFNEFIDKGVAGSETVLGIRGQIEKTIQRFPDVREIKLVVDGKREVVLEP